MNIYHNSSYLKNVDGFLAVGLFELCVLVGVLSEHYEIGLLFSIESNGY